MFVKSLENEDENENENAVALTNRLGGKKESAADLERWFLQAKRLSACPSSGNGTDT